MLLLYYFAKPTSWIIPWIIQAFIYFRLLKKMGQNGKYALIPFVAESRFSRIFFKNRRYYTHTLIVTIIFLIGGAYLRYYAKGTMSAIYGILFNLLAMIVYGVFLMALYWKIARSFGKKFFYCLLTVLFPFFFLFLLTRRKETFYHGPTFRRSRFVTRPMRFIYNAVTELGFLGIAAALFLGVAYLSITSYLPRPLVSLLLNDKSNDIANLHSDGKIIDREATMGDEYYKLNSEYAPGREKYFPDHSHDKSVVVLEYIIGSNLEDMYGLASFNIDQMIKATKNGSSLKFVIEAGGSGRWFTSGIKDNSRGRYVIENGKLTQVEELDATVTMSSPDTLYDFLDWAKNNIEADRYMLVFWDHGGGLSSGYGQDDLNKREDNKYGTMLINEMAEALEKAGMKFDLIGFDACLMQGVEVAKALEPYADYYLASEETESGDGWFYTTAFKLLARDPGVATEVFAKEMISSFDVYNTVLKNGKEQADTTLSIIDLTRINPAYDLLTDLYDRQDEAIKADSSNYRDISAAASVSYKFFGEEQLDLIHYLELLDDSDYDDTIISSEELQKIINYFKAAVVYRNAVSNEGINGLAVSFPYGSISSYKDDHTQYAALEMDKASNFYDDYFSIMAYQKKESNKPVEIFGIEIPTTDYTEEEWYVAGFENYENIENIIDIPLMEKDGAYELQLPENVWKIIMDAQEVYYQKADEGWRYLGTDVAGMLDENDRPLLSTDGYWIFINNQLICYEATDKVVSDEGVIYKGVCRALLNNEKEIVLNIEWEPINEETGEDVTGKVTGYYLADNDTYYMEKGLHEIKPGETIQFLFDYYDEQGELIKSEPYGNTIRVTAMDSLRVEDKHLKECDLRYGIVLTDIYQRTFATEMVESHITD